MKEQQLRQIVDTLEWLTQPGFDPAKLKKHDKQQIATSAQELIKDLITTINDNSHQLPKDYSADDFLQQYSQILQQRWLKGIHNQTLNKCHNLFQNQTIQDLLQKVAQDHLTNQKDLKLIRDVNDEDYEKAAEYYATTLTILPAAAVNDNFEKIQSNLQQLDQYLVGHLATKQKNQLNTYLNLDTSYQPDIKNNFNKLTNLIDEGHFQQNPDTFNAQQIANRINEKLSKIDNNLQQLSNQLTANQRQRLNRYLGLDDYAEPNIENNFKRLTQLIDESHFHQDPDTFDAQQIAERINEKLSNPDNNLQQLLNQLTANQRQRLNRYLGLDDNAQPNIKNNFKRLTQLIDESHFHQDPDTFDARKAARVINRNLMFLKLKTNVQQITRTLTNHIQKTFKSTKQQFAELMNSTDSMAQDLLNGPTTLKTMILNPNTLFSKQTKTPDMKYDPNNSNTNNLNNKKQN